MSSHTSAFCSSVRCRPARRARSCRRNLRHLCNITTYQLDTPVSLCANNKDVFRRDDKYETTRMPRRRRCTNHAPCLSWNNAQAKGGPTYPSRSTRCHTHTHTQQAPHARWQGSVELSLTPQVFIPQVMPPGENRIPEAKRVITHP